MERISVLEMGGQNWRSYMHVEKIKKWMGVCKMIDSEQ